MPNLFQEFKKFNVLLRSLFSSPVSGSAYKVKMGKYYYYCHCSSECVVQFKSELTNTKFQKLLLDLGSKKECLRIFRDSFIAKLKERTKQRNHSRNRGSEWKTQKGSNSKSRCRTWTNRLSLELSQLLLYFQPFSYFFN